MPEPLYRPSPIDAVPVPRALRRDRMAPRVTLPQRCDECGTLLTDDNPPQGVGCLDCEGEGW